MENGLQLAKRLREVLLDGTWIANTNYQDQIYKSNYNEATKKVGSLNTIALLTFHIDYYVAGVLNVFDNGQLTIHDKYSFDMPELQGPKDWDQLRNTFLINAEQLAKHVEVMTKAQLEEVFVDEKYGSFRRNIEGLIEHAYYHLGQVSLIRKMVLEELNR